MAVLAHGSRQGVPPLPADARLVPGLPPRAELPLSGPSIVLIKERLILDRRGTNVEQLRAKDGHQRTEAGTYPDLGIW